MKQFIFKICQKFQKRSFREKMNRNEVYPTPNHTKEQKEADQTQNIANNQNLPLAHPDAVKPAQVHICYQIILTTGSGMCLTW
jgi:hypothetical protein